jgi:hypothetical protein
MRMTAFRGWVWLYIGMYSKVDGATCIISYQMGYLSDEEGSNRKKIFDVL